MSKIGNYYLDLQEQANELGFDTVEEAFDAGYEVHMGKLQQHGDYMDGGKTELEQAHEAWLKERDEVIKGLQSTWFHLNNLGKRGDADNISRAMKLIEEGEM